MRKCPQSVMSCRETIPPGQIFDDIMPLPAGSNIGYAAEKQARPSANRVLKDQLTSREHLPFNERHDQCEDHPAERLGEHAPAQLAALETCVVQRPCEIHCGGDRIREESNPSKGQCQDREMDQFAQTLHSQLRGTRCTTTGTACSGHSCNHTSRSSPHQRRAEKAGVEAVIGLILSGYYVENLW